MLQTLARPATGAVRINGVAGADRFGRYDDGIGGDSTRPTRVLVIDDDPSVRHTLGNYLEQHNMRVVSAVHRQQVTRQFEGGEPGVVIMDVRVGQEDGLDLLREIRSRSDVPVIIATGRRHDEADRVVGLELGADDYVSKPFGLRELLARIRAVLRRQGMGRIAAQRESGAGTVPVRRLATRSPQPVPDGSKWRAGCADKGRVCPADRLPRRAATAAQSRTPVAGDTDSRRRHRPQHRCADPSPAAQARG